MGILYPVRRVGTLSVSLTGVLDQSFQVSQQQTIELGGTGTEARITDTFRSEGGVSVLRVGLARRLGSTLSVGLSAGTYIGNVRCPPSQPTATLPTAASPPPPG